MDSGKNRRERTDIADGLKAALPVVLGYFFVATAFGLLVRSAGLALWQGQGFSLFVFAGASQFASLSLLKEGAPAAVIILTVFVMNLRHLLMSANLSGKMTGFPRVLLPFAAFGVTDETFAVASLRREALTPGFMLALNTASWAGWNLGTLTGFQAGGFLPPPLVSAMTLGLYILFVALLVPALRGNLRGAVLALSAAVLHTGLKILLPGLASWSFLIAVVTVCLGAALVREPR
jgi:predicted branched-subunit amino acid permease